MRIKSTGQRATPCHFLTPDLPESLANLTTPFGQRVVAWVNGTHFFSPIHAPAVRKRKPRTEHIDLSAQYCDLSQGW